MAMVKTSVYLPDELKGRLARAARVSGQSEATIVRSALEQWLAATLRTAAASGMLGSINFGDPDLARNVDDRLHGFGES
jgi:predicted transcriptional regulator